MDGIGTTLRIGIGLAALAAGPGAPPGERGSAAEAAFATGSPFAGIPGLEVEYYDVSGRTAAEIRASLNRLGPADAVTGKRVDGITWWHLDWRIPRSPDGECRLDRAEVTLDVAVELPRLVDTDGVPLTVRQRWERFVAALKAHEAIHTRSLYRSRQAMLRAIHGAECATADQAARDVMEAMRRWNEDFDRRTKHGQTEGVRFP